MNDPIKEIERLAKIARLEPAPEVSVSGKVMARISELDEADDRALSLMAAASVAAAGLVGLLNSSLMLTLTDPLCRLFQMLPGLSL